MCVLCRNGHSERHKYETVDGMMKHEIEVNKKTNEALLGSRILLRLFRTLVFTTDASKSEKCFQPINSFVYIVNYQSKYAIENRK